MTSGTHSNQIAKASMRAAAEARRAAIAAAHRQANAAQIATLVADWVARNGQPAACVSGFLSIGSEIDTVPTLERLTAAGYSIALPAMLGPRLPLVFRAWRPGQPLETVKWGIREPGPDAETVVPEILLIPLLAFDRRGGRLGYGGGFYDRTLQQLRAGGRIIAAGLAFSQQEVDAVPGCDYDEPLDWVLTPSRAIRCQP